MKTLLLALRQFMVAVGVLVVGIIVGNVLYRAIGDLLAPSGMDRSPDAATGAGVLFGLLALLAHVVRRVLRRRKKLQPEPAR